MVAEAARLNGLQSRIKVLNSELEQVRKEEGVVDQLEGTISDLQRQKELEETNYKYYATHLEAERIDETLGAGHALNIAEIQKPSPPEIDSLKQFKLLGGIAGGGLALGVAWAFLIELYLDRSIRRAKDIEKVLNIPLFLSIPDFGRNGHNKNVFHETLRDRLIGYFESKNLTHKPKLLAVTGVGRNSGVTTTAAGLAKCLSETGEGNVLLVDMTQNQGSAQQFNNGKAVCGFDQLLDTRNNALVQDKFYVVGEEPNSERLTRALPSRFSQLVPQLKASDFDYIIFDMPPVSQISITPRLAGFMDMVLLVVESEHTDKEIARQAAELLGASRAHVGIVLNKTRNYLPSKLHHDFLGTG
jgi:Mrp family chromosome partitioning ATPase